MAQPALAKNGMIEYDTHKRFGERWKTLKCGSESYFSHSELKPPRHQPKFCGLDFCKWRLHFNKGEITNIIATKHQ